MLKLVSHQPANWGGERHEFRSR